MDIRNWPMSRVMQLPDWCFGRRWPVGVRAAIPGAGAVFDMSDVQLPDRFVIWEVVAIQRYAAGSSVEVTLATGLQVPANDAAFDELPLLFPQINSVTGRLGALDLVYLTSSIYVKVKVPIVGQGSHIVGRFIRTVGTGIGIQVSVIISSIPREVPDWLISGQDKNL